MAFWSDPSSLFPKQSHRWVVYLEKERSTESREMPHYLAKSVDRPSYKIDTVQAKYLYSHTFNFPKRLLWNPIKIEFYDVFWLEKRGSEADITGPGTEEFKVRKAGSTVTSITEDAVIFTATPDRGTYLEYSGRDETKFREIIKTDAKTTQKFFYDFLKNSGYYDPDESVNSNDQLNRFRSYHFKKNMITALTGQATERDLLDKKSDDNTKDYIYLEELDGDGITIEQWKIYNPLITDVTPSKLDYASDTVLSISVGITYDWAELTYFNRNAKLPTTKSETE